MKILIGFMLLLISSIVNAETNFVTKNSLSCLSEKQFDYQFKLLAENIMKYAEGCYKASMDVEVIILDFGMLGKSKVQAVDDGTVFWVASANIYSIGDITHDD